MPDKASPPTFDLSLDLPGEFEQAYDEAAARARESHWHSSQREEVNADGTVDLTFEVGGLLEITPWILTWGETIEVLEPLVLRERLATVALGMARRYTEPAGNQ